MHNIENSKANYNKNKKDNVFHKNRKELLIEIL